MAKPKVRNGDVLEIPLPKGLGFAYAKYIDLTQDNSSSRYPCLVQVYNFRATERLVSIDNLEDIDLLFSPLLVGGVPPTVSKGKWKVVGNFPVSEIDNHIPDFKLHEPPVLTNDEDAEEWFYVVNADISKKNKSEYSNVKHLETLGAIGSDLLPIKVAMGLIKSEGENILDYFELEEFAEKVYFNQVQNTPLFFELPDGKKGKALSL